MKTDAKWLTDGLLSGFAAYFSSIVFFLIANAAAGLPVFYTPALLGSVIFYGAHDAAAVDVWAGPVLAFNGLFLIVLVLLGEVVAGVSTWLSRRDRLPMIAVAAFLIAAAPLVYGAARASRMVSVDLPWLLIVPASISAIAAMLLTLYEWDPQLRPRRRHT